MKPEETILIPIKASEELPKENELWLHVICKDGHEDMAYYKDKEWNVWCYENGDVEFWYKPISKKEYDKRIIEGYEMWLHECNDINEVPLKIRKYINLYIKEQMNK